MECPKCSKSNNVITMIKISSSLSLIVYKCGKCGLVIERSR